MKVFFLSICLIFYSCLTCFADTEKEFIDLKDYFSKNKLTIYKSIALGSEFKQQEQYLRSVKIQVQKECNSKYPKLCLYSLTGENVINLKEGILTFYDNVLIQISLQVIEKNKKRQEVISEIVKNINMPYNLLYRTNGVEEKISSSSIKNNFCNIDQENSPKLVKIFQGIQWSMEKGSVNLMSLQLRSFLDNSSKSEDCNNSIGELLGISTRFNDQLEDKFQSLIMEI